MPAIFPKWTNRLPLAIIIGILFIATGVTAGIWYYFTPKYTDVGYQPIQPVAFPHSTHVDQLGMDCRYCHSTVEKSWFSNIPASSTCMNCHNQVLKDDPRLAMIRDSAQTGKPVPWVHIHRLPDFAYFNHSVHVNRGVSCVHCHGNINRMDEVQQAKPLNMTFCLECHRNPEPNLRPLDKITDLNWDPHKNLPKEWFQRTMQEWKIEKPENCSACHR